MHKPVSHSKYTNIVFSPLSACDQHCFEQVIQFILAYRQEMFCHAPAFEPHAIPYDLTPTGFIQTYITNPKGFFGVVKHQSEYIGGIGFCPLKLTNQEGKPRFANGIAFVPEFDPTHAIEIVKIYLKPQYRSCGLGTLMVDHLKKYAKQRHLHHLYLHTHPHPILPNDAAYFWQKQGFINLQQDNDAWQTLHMYSILTPH